MRVKIELACRKRILLRMQFGTNALYHSYIKLNFLAEIIQWILSSDIDRVFEKNCKGFSGYGPVQPYTINWKTCLGNMYHQWIHKMGSDHRVRMYRGPSRILCYTTQWDRTHSGSPVLPHFRYKNTKNHLVRVSFDAYHTRAFQLTLHTKW